METRSIFLLLLPVLVSGIVHRHQSLLDSRDELKVLDEAPPGVTFSTQDAEQAALMQKANILANANSDVDLNPDLSKPTQIVRIVVPFSDLSEMMCVTANWLPVPHLAVEKCSYDPRQFFSATILNRVLFTVTLQPIVAGFAGYWAPSPTVPASLGDIFFGKIPYTLSTTDRHQFFLTTKGGFRGPARIRTSISYGTVKYCMQVAREASSMTLYGRSFTDASVCSYFYVTPAQDDLVVGPIVNFRLMLVNGVLSLQQMCVTFNAQVQPPLSALSLAPCSNATEQNFVYNLVTKHLRAVNATGSGLFFWWRGAMKTIPDLESTDLGYGWDIPINRAGPVLAQDSRGYSGWCWTNTSQVMVEQTCGVYAMLPRASGFLYSFSRIGQQNLGVAVVTSDNRCLTLQRIPQLQSGLPTNEQFWYRFYFSNCSTSYDIRQRFLLTTPSGTCNSTSCVSYFRWVGDSNIIINPRMYESYDEWIRIPAITKLIGTGFRGTYMVQELPGLYQVPFQTSGRMIVMSWDYRPYCLRDCIDSACFTSDLRTCLSVSVVPATWLAPDSESAQTTTFARFDYRAMLVLSNDASVNTSIVDQLRNSTLDPKQTAARDLLSKIIERNYDLFHADLGYYGSNRFRRVGSDVVTGLAGELICNTNQARPNGLMFSFLSDIEQYSAFSMSVYFRFESNSTILAGNSYMLMSFARSSGCVVYVTSRGSPGLKCYYASQVVLSAQLSKWPGNLLDGRFHKVSLVFTTTTSSPVQLFIDGVSVISLTNPVTWWFGNTASAFRLFYDPFHWEYLPFPASLLRSSLQATNDITLLVQAAAKINVPGWIKPMAPLLASQLALVSSQIQTEWRNCVVRNGTGPLYQGLECTLVTKIGVTKTNVSIDTFSLACSRPFCRISFLPNQPLIGNSFRFLYQPNYPTQFVSENVGRPALFQDPAFVTDGFKTRIISFGVQYSPGSSFVETGLRDPSNYVAVQSCCVSINGILATAIGFYDAVF